MDIKKEYRNTEVLSSHNDLELVAAAKTGDKAAQEKILLAMGRRILSEAKRMSNNPSHIDDFVS